MSALRGLTLPRLTAATGWSPEAIKRLSYRIEERYEAGTVPKKDGGTRELLKPEPFLKSFQRRLYHTILRHHSYHPSVYSAPGCSALGAARFHKGHSHLLHLDIEDFFPSISVHRIRSALDREGVEPRLVSMLTRLLTARGSLPQGAPTSPAIANVVLAPLDRRLAGLCQTSGGGFAYTRFVDDLAISGGGRLRRFEAQVRKIVRDAGWKLNERGGLLGPNEPHRLLGVIAGCELSVGEDYLQVVRRTLSDLRRGTTQLDSALVHSLRGRINWIEAVEPVRGARLKKILESVLEGSNPASPETRAGLLLH